MTSTPVETSLMKSSSDVPFYHLARYLNDLWLFDTQEYKWNQVEFRDMDAKPCGPLMILFLT